jgi:hypothetical protein
MRNKSKDTQMKNHIKLIAIAVLFLQGCAINEQYQLSERERIQRYLDSNPGTIKRVLETSFLFFVEATPEAHIEFNRFLEGLEKEVMKERTRQLSHEELTAEIRKFLELEDWQLPNLQREKLVDSLTKLYYELLEPSLSNDEQKKILVSFAIENVFPVAQRNEIEEYIKESFFGGYVICGMNKDDVLVIKGRPDSKYESIDSAFRRYSRWSYDNYGDSQTITFINDVVDDISAFEHRYRY